MCIIATQLPGQPTLDLETLTNCWDYNPHGAGYMFALDGKLIIRKAFFDLMDLVESYTNAHQQCGKLSPFVLHFRWCTHGKINEINTHPHKLCNGTVGLVHNGILPILPPPKSKISDTVYFCRTVLSKRPASQLVGKRYNETLTSMIGKHNKLVLLDNTGKLSIVNEAQGIWDGGNWFSNDSYLPCVASSNTTTPYLFDYDDRDICTGAIKWDDLTEDEWREAKEFCREEEKELEQWLERKYLQQRMRNKF